MGKRGPKKIPTNILRLRGSRQVENRPKNEPIPKQGMPQPPEFLHGEALAEWGRKATMLYEQGTLTLIDDTALAAYCEVYALYVESVDDCYDAKLGTIIKLIKRANGDMVRNPVLMILNQAREQMIKMAAQFGMTPSGRTGINVPKPVTKKETKAQKWVAKNKA